MALATLTHVGRAAIALAISGRPLHLAWGGGVPAWDGPEAELPSLVDATALASELGRRAPDTVAFVEPDEAGEIVIPVTIGGEGAVQEARYSLATDGTPTPFLYMRVNFDYADAGNAVIREMGVFMDTEFVDELPPGQRYFLPGDIADPGLLLAAQIIVPSINRSPSVRQTVEFVLPI
ncbi:MAG: phage tail protein [Desulfovibrio sp.]|jgi:hypothetical protein|nr:phage tail protein [Desulfovibrio sp.]